MQTVLNFFLLAFMALSVTVNAQSMSFSSDAIKKGSEISSSQVFNGFGCTGGNISPDLKWTAGPEGTKFYAVTMYDPDAPTGSGWWHWLVFNIPANILNLPAGVGHSHSVKLPNGVIQSRTDFGTVGYGGPCPPSGTQAHRYIFKVYALKDSVPLDEKASGAMVGFYLGQLKLAEASFEAKYGR